MAQLEEQHSNDPKPERYYIEYVELSTEKASANEPLREAINGKMRRGWRLLRVTRDPSGDGVELVWDTSWS